MENFKTVTPEEAVKAIKSGDRVHLSSVAVTPHCLINAMVERGRRKEFKDVKIQHIHTEGPAPYANAEFEGTFMLESFFVGGNVRKATQTGYADYIPVFLCETQKLIREGYLKVNVAMVQVSPPDKHGYVSLGTSVDATLAAIQEADTVIAQINKNVPRTWGDAQINIRDIDIFVECDEPLYIHENPPITDVEKAIGKNVAALVEDGACLQMGIGGIPNAVLAELGNHKDLGIHTEMFSDGLLPLIESGVVNNKKKQIDIGKCIASFLMGSQVLYDFVDDNPMVAMMDVRHTNSVPTIRQNHKVTAINSALAVDITGQVCADSIGIKHYSGSKISPTLIEGSGVVTTRANMHWLVTEYGAINLYGKTLQERAKLIISIAHPNHQETLDEAAFDRFGSHFHYVG